MDKYGLLAVSAEPICQREVNIWSKEQDLRNISIILAELLEYGTFVGCVAHVRPYGGSYHNFDAEAKITCW